MNMLLNDYLYLIEFIKESPLNIQYEFYQTYTFVFFDNYVSNIIGLKIFNTSGNGFCIFHGYIIKNNNQKINDAYQVFISEDKIFEIYTFYSNKKPQTVACFWLFDFEQEYYYTKWFDKYNISNYNNYPQFNITF